MEKQIAGALLSIGAVFLRPEEPFTWASGIKSPIYCDNRLTLTGFRIILCAVAASALGAWLMPRPFEEEAADEQEAL